MTSMIPIYDSEAFEERLLVELLAVQATKRIGDTSRPTRQHTRRVITIAAVAAVAIGVVALQTLPSSLDSPSSASAAQFLRKAATSVLKVTAQSDQGVELPQPDQYVYDETEDPSGTLTMTWLSVSGSNPGLQQWTSGIAGAVPSTGEIPYPACTVVQSEDTGCFPEVGYFPNMPTSPSALLAYLNGLGIIDTKDATSVNVPGWAANDLAKGLMSLMETSYLLPTQQAAIFNLMAQTPGFTIVPNMNDALGRTGVGVEWTFEGGSGALIFDPTTYALLGTRTWPGAPDVNAPYDGNALIGVSVVNSLPSSQG